MPVPSPGDLVEDDGEMVTRAEREGRRKIREEFAAARATRRKGPSPAQDRQMEAALDSQAPGWRERAAAAKPGKQVRLANQKARPARSNVDTPIPAPEDLATPAAHRTLALLQARWSEALTRAGKSPTTVTGYRAEIQKACDHFGDSTPVADLTPARITAYNDSDRVTKTRTGKPAAKPGVDKTRRALRMALGWAEKAGWIEGIANSSATP